MTFRMAASSASVNCGGGEAAGTQAESPRAPKRSKMSFTGSTSHDARHAGKLTSSAGRGAEGAFKRGALISRLSRGSRQYFTFVRICPCASLPRRTEAQMKRCIERFVVPLLGFAYGCGGGPPSPGIGQTEAPLWVVDTNEDLGPSWSSNGHANHLSGWRGVDCPERIGQQPQLLGSLRLYKEPVTNLDNFIGRLQAGCMPFRQIWPSGFDPMGLGVEYLQLFNRNARSARNTTSVPVHGPGGVGETAVGLRLTVNNNSHVKDIQFLSQRVQGGAIPTSNPTISPAATGYGGSVETLECGPGKVLSGMRLQYDDRNGKIRRLQIYCRAIESFQNVSEVFGAPSAQLNSPFNDTCPADGGNRIPNAPSQVRRCTVNDRDCLRRVTIDTNEFPDAVCNDNSPAVFYVRRGYNNPTTNQSDTDKWIIHLQGGGRCDSFEECRDRWCGDQGLIFSANKMSTDWDGDGSVNLPAKGQLRGLHNPDANNPFSTWNHVFVYYCSSDSWMGRGDAAYSASTSTSPDRISVRHHGHDILRAVRTMLRKNNSVPGWFPDQDRVDGYSTAALIPDIDAASEIWITGTSAGAKGALMNADWFLSAFPNAVGRIALDGNIDPSPNVVSNETLRVDEGCDGTPDQLLSESRLDREDGRWNGGWYEAIDAFVDQSCRSHLEPLGRIGECSLMTPLLTAGRTVQVGGMIPIPLFIPHVSHPVFMRLDLEDPVLGRSFTRLLNSGDCLRIGAGASPPRTTGNDFPRLMRATLEELYSSTASPLTGTFGPRCGEHVGFEQLRPFAAHTTPDTASNLEVPGTRTNLADALWGWRSAFGSIFVPNRGLYRRLDSDGSTSFSVCP